MGKGDCLSVSLHHKDAVPSTARLGCQIHWDWSSRLLWAAIWGVGMESGSAFIHLALLHPIPSVSDVTLFSYKANHLAIPCRQPRKQLGWEACTTRPSFLISFWTPHYLWLFYTGLLHLASLLIWFLPVKQFLSYAFYALSVCFSLHGGTSPALLNRCGSNKHSCFIHDFKEKSFHCPKFLWNYQGAVHVWL